MCLLLEPGQVCQGLWVLLSCAGEARSSVLSFWHSFVEPFFGRGQRQYVPLHTKTEMQQLEAEEHVEKQSSSSEEPEEPKGEPGVCSGRGWSTCCGCLQDHLQLASVAA